MQKLNPIIFDKEYSAFNITGGRDEFYTQLTLLDYDWMHYTLIVKLPTKQYGKMLIEFEYIGTKICIMKVETFETSSNASTAVYNFKFNSNIFKEHIIKFLQKHISSWDSPYAFEGIEESVNFYNAVITAPDTISYQNIVTDASFIYTEECNDCSAYDSLTEECTINGNCHLVEKQNH